MAYAFAVLMLAPGLVVGGSHERPARARESKRPNVLLIITDDQREGLDVMPVTRRKFIQKGRHYPEGFVTTPACCPSRASIFTGRYVHNHGVVNNRASQKLDPRTMLQYYLQRKGYRTAIFGKFLNSWGPYSSPPYFNKWGIFAKPESQSLYRKVSYNLNGDLERRPGYSTSVITRLTKEYLETSDKLQDSKPWMAVVAPAAPHFPYTAEREYRGTRVGGWDGNPAVFEVDRSDKPAYVRDQSRSFDYGKRIRRKQLRTLLSVDDMIKKIFKKMGRLNERNTIAIFISDNGLLWGEHGLSTKHVPYSDSVRVPFMMRWPDHVESGSTDDRLAANIDILPTVLDAVGIDLADPQFDGKSLLDETWTRDRLLLEHVGRESGTGVPPWASTITKNYQYTEYYNDDGIVTFYEYYNLDNDPWQLDNLYEDGSELNDPPMASYHQQLTLDRECGPESTPCP